MNLDGSFEGFDGQGARIRGSFDSGASAQSSNDARSDFQGLKVSLGERSDLSTTVASDGRFALAGVPAGSWSLLFERDGRRVGEIRFRSVRSNQEIRIVVAMDGPEVVLLEEERDRVSFDEECPRGPGFWCQNQGGKNPNLSEAEFKAFAAEAARLLARVAALDTPEEVAAAVCDTGDQLLRHLATLALNLASGAVSRDTALVDEPLPTVGTLFDRAVEVAATSGVSRDERNRIKDVMDRTNNGQNIASCDTEPDDDDDDDGDDDDGDDDPPPASGKVTICHIPPGNPANRHTITVGASAWPSHRAHGDTLGACR